MVYIFYFLAKIRRLYDIANVLSSLNLIKKVHVTEERGRKPAFKWTGPEISPNPSGTYLFPFILCFIVLNQCASGDILPSPSCPHSYMQRTRVSYWKDKDECPYESLAAGSINTPRAKTPPTLYPRGRIWSWKDLKKWKASQNIRYCCLIVMLPSDRNKAYTHREYEVNSLQYHVLVSISTPGFWRFTFHQRMKCLK